MVYIGGGIYHTGESIENVGEKVIKSKAKGKGVVKNMPIDSRTLFRNGYRSVVKD
jgi:hypothetical protein